MHEDEDARLWAVIDAAGHLECGGWHYDTDLERLFCRCTARLFKAAMVRAT